MHLTHVPLAIAGIALEPLADPHRGGLRAACAADPDIWATLYPYSMLGAAFDDRWAWLVEAAARGAWLPFAVLNDGAVVGTTNYIEPDPQHGTVEIGGTYYQPGARGGPVNPAAKLLLMGHAFACGARRVVFRVDALNARSRAAVRKLGAVDEGILRQDRVTWTGRIRDTVVFSVLVSEWPTVRAALEDRLVTLRQPGTGTGQSST